MSDDTASRNSNPGVPRLDARFDWLELPRRLVPASLMLLERDGSGTDFPARDLALLEAGGVVEAGRLHRTARRILGPLSHPSVIMSMQTFDPDASRIATAWRTPDAATLGISTGVDTFRLWSVHVGLIPFHLASVAGLHVAPAPPRPALTVDTEDWTQWQSGRPGSGRPIGSRDRDLPDLDRRWRASTMWSEPDGFVGDRSVEVVDCPVTGYWETTEMAGGESILLTPRTVDDVLRLLSDLDPYP